MVVVAPATRCGIVGGRGLIFLVLVNDRRRWVVG
jgi:hypothetical protein